MFIEFNFIFIVVVDVVVGSNVEDFYVIDDVSCSFENELFVYEFVLFFLVLYLKFLCGGLGLIIGLNLLL